MLELKLAGIHDDGENLVLESADGASYLLPIDQNLRQSIARARRISPARGKGGTGVFGPRDIQARFRQGASVEEIAAESGWEAERVRRYEWPIVAERANIIHTARNLVISATPGSNTPTQTLNEHIAAVSERFGFDETPMEWSTWLQESGQWTIAVSIDVPEELHKELPRGVMFPARWSFNPANQGLYASNEAAYFLMGRDHTPSAPIPGVGAGPASPSEPTEQITHARSTATSAEDSTVLMPPTPVRVPINKEQNELLDELTARRGVRSFDPASERKLADLLERARRSSRPVGEALPHPAITDIEPGAVSTSQEDSETSLPAVQTEAETVEAEVNQTTAEAESTANLAEAAPSLQEAEPPHAAAHQHDATDQGANGTSSQPENETPAAEIEELSVEEPAENPAKPVTRSSRGKRTSVPSWDDIIFGNQRR